MSNIKTRIINDAFQHKTQNQMSDAVRAGRWQDPDRSGALKRVRIPNVAFTYVFNDFLIHKYTNYVVLLR
jgi:hypothetical protein